MHTYMGLQLGWGGSDMEESEWDKYFSFSVSFFFSVSPWEEEMGLFLANKLDQHQGTGRSFDDTLKTPVSPQGCRYLSGFDSSRSCWFGCSRFNKIFPKSIF